MKLLIIEDEEIVRDFLSQMAKDRGYVKIDTAGTGEEALTQVIRNDYDLITLDIKMPGVSGLEIIAMLRNMCPHAVIAIVSGYIPDEMSRETAGCIDVMIPKPVDVGVFNQLLDEARQIRQIMDRIRSLGITPIVR